MSIDLLTGDRTRADSVVLPVLERPTRTSHDALAAVAGYTHALARGLSNDAVVLQRRAIAVQLRTRTEETAKRAVPDLLNELAEGGLAWRDIARLVGVTVPAVRKWRQGGPSTSEHRKSIAKLLAFIELLRSEHMVMEGASWLEMTLAESSITGLDLYASGLIESLVLYAASVLSSEELLDEYDPQWRNSIDDRFEIFTAADGHPSIRLRGAELIG